MSYSEGRARRNGWRSSLLILLPILFFTLLSSLPEKAQNPPDATPDWSGVQAAIGAQGQQSNGAIRFTVLRSDISGNINGTPVDSNLAFDGFIAFAMIAGTNSAIMTAEFPLQETEVQAAVQAAQQAGLTVSALHNHLEHETPRVLFLFIESVGDPVALANAAVQVLKTSGGTVNTSPPGTGNPPGLTSSQIAGILGGTFQVLGPVLQVTVPRTDSFLSCDFIIDQTAGTLVGQSSAVSTSTNGSAQSRSCNIAALQSNGHAGSNPANGTSFQAESGVESQFNFQSVGSGQAIVAAEFALTPPEVFQTVRTLKQTGFNVTAVNNHFINEVGRLIFVDASAVGSPLTLAQTIRGILNTNAQLSGIPTPTPSPTPTASPTPTPTVSPTPTPKVSPTPTPTVSPTPTPTVSPTPTPTVSPTPTPTVSPTPTPTVSPTPTPTVSPTPTPTVSPTPTPTVSPTPTPTVSPSP
jgi:Domain of Unknown Function (DUF1259)